MRGSPENMPECEMTWVTSMKFAYSISSELIIMDCRI